MCSCCATSPSREVCRAKGGFGETLCHDIYPVRPITTVSLATNTYCMMDGHSSCAPRTVGPRIQFSGACEHSHWWPARHTAGGHLLSVVQTASLYPVLANGYRLKRIPSNPLCLPENLISKHTSTASGMRALLKVCDDYGKEYFMRFNANKSKCMYMPPYNCKTL